MHANEIVSIIPTVQSKLRSVYERYVVFFIKQFIQYGNYQHIYHTMNIYTDTFALPWGVPGSARALASFIMSVRQGMNAVVLYVPFVVKSAQTQLRDLNCI